MRHLAVDLAVPVLGALQVIIWRSIVDKAALLTERLPREDVEIPDVGTITVRGLSRYELLLAGKSADAGPIVMERKMLAMAMVSPSITEDEAEAWQKVAPAGEIAPVMAAINRLSGVGKDAHREAYKSLSGEPGAGIRILSGEGATDDGSGPSPDDEWR